MSQVWTWQDVRDRVKMLNDIGAMTDLEVHFIATSRWRDAPSYERVTAARLELKRRGLNEYGRSAHDSE